MKLLILCIATQFVFGQILFAQSGMWGVTSAGGGDDIGTIFSTDGNGEHYEQQYTWRSDVSGSSPRVGFTEGADGKLYGVTYSGGRYGLGVLFEYDPQFDTYIKRAEFEGAANGANPYGNLVLAANGKFYGTTLIGGTNNKGVIFEYDPVEKIMTTKVHLETTTGSISYGGLLESANGKLYGLTSQGGMYNQGVLFEYRPHNGAYSVIVNFDGTALGRSPFGRLTKGNTANVLYGMTVYGGDNDQGTIFKFNTETNTVIKTYDFSSTLADGYEPLASLELANNGDFYGMTNKGGNDNKGVLFEYDPTNDTYTKRIDFDGVNGKELSSNLTNGVGDVMYGLSSSGGSSNAGTLFEYNTSTHTLLKKTDLHSTTKGALPYGDLILKNGKYYGMTSSGGAYNSGVIFEYDPTTGVYTLKKQFESTVKGARPYGNLFEASNGLIYGLTRDGGLYGKGTLYEFNPITNQTEVKVDFLIGLGTFPEGGLIEPITGKLYGVTIGGGAYIGGTVFEYDINTETIVVKASFNKLITGSNPYGNLLKASDGYLYGTTYNGGVNDLGTIFRYDLTSSNLAKKVDFDGVSKGSNPRSGLMETNGALYGVTVKGGVNDDGVLYEYNFTTNTFTTKVDFENATTGNKPFAMLTSGSATEVFGTTFSGGVNAIGTLFKFDVSTNTFTKIIDFDGVTNGKNPIGSLSLNTNGKLYGMTNTGGANDGGVLYEFDLTSNSLVVKNDFNLAEGQYAKPGLIQICRKPAYEVPEETTYNVCVGEELVIDLEVENATNFVWKKDGVTTATFTNDSLSFTSITQTDGGVYTLEMTNICGATTTMPITINVSNDGLPTVGVSATATGVSSQTNANEINLCKGGFLTLEGTGAVSYEWDNEVNDGQLFVPIVNETYTVKGTDVNGCSSTFSLAVVVNNQPDVIAHVDKLSVCQGEEIKLTGSGAASYTWSHNALDGIAYSLTTSTAFTVEGTSASGCKNTAGVVVTAYLPPVLGVVTDKTAACQGALVTLTASGNAVLYQWGKGVINGLPFPIFETGTYTVIATSAENCISTEGIDLTAYALPVVTITPHDNNICEGTEVVLTGEGADEYIWNNGVEDGIPFMVSATSNYSVVGIDNTNGCRSFASTIVVVDNCTGLSGIDNTGISVYPNPFTSEIVIRNEKESINSLIIYSFDGNVIKTINTNESEEVVVNLSDLAIGTYFVKINTTNSSYQVKVMKN